jgi:hypothetical protein
MICPGSPVQICRIDLLERQHSIGVFSIAQRST